MTTEKCSFEDMRTFFGRKSDQRAELYVDTIRHIIVDLVNSKVITPTGLPINFASQIETAINALAADSLFNLHKTKLGNNITTQINKGENYENDGNSSDTADAWKNYFFVLNERLGGLDEKNADPRYSNGTLDVNANEILSLIRKIGNEVGDNHHIEYTNKCHLFVTVIKLHLESLKNDIGGDVLTSPQLWNTATEFKFKTNFNEVFGYDNLSSTGTGTGTEIIFSTPTNIIPYYPVQNPALTALNAFKFANTKVTMFSFRLDKWGAKLQCDWANKSSNGSGSSDEFWNSLNGVNNEEAYVRLNDYKVYFMKDNGEPIDIESAEYKSMCKERCYGHLDGNKCAELVNECLENGNGKDIEKCKRFLVSDDYWPNIKNEIKTLNIKYATKLLDKLGFETDTKHVTINNKHEIIKEYESFTSWAGRLSDSIAPEDASKILNNQKLMEYLKTIIDKINTNPAILNRNVMSRDTSQPYISNRFAGTYLSNIGLNPAIISPISDVRNIHNIMSHLQNFRTIQNNKISNGPGNTLLIGKRVFIHPTIKFGSRSYGDLIGGGEEEEGEISNEIKLKELINNISGGSASLHEKYCIKLSLLIRKYFNYYVNKLALVGKDISDDDKKTFEKKINELEKYENDLFKIVDYLHKYGDLLEVYNAYDKNDIFTFETIKKFVDEREKFFDKSFRKAEPLIDNLIMIGDMVNSQLSK